MDDLDARVKEIEKMARDRRAERDKTTTKPGAVAVRAVDEPNGIHSGRRKTPPTRRSSLVAGLGTRVKEIKKMARERRSGARERSQNQG